MTSSQRVAALTIVDAPNARPHSQVARGEVLLNVPEITSDTESGFCDLLFAPASHSVRPDGSQTVVARGVHHGLEVGFSIELSPAWEPFEIDVLTPPYLGQVTLIADRPHSDRLLSALDGLYGVNEHPCAMAERVSCTTFALDGYPPSLRRKRINLKLFVESEHDAALAEVFLNIDLRARRIELRERNIDYRRALVHALANGC